MEDLEEGVSGIASIGRSRNSCIEVLTEGDVFILDELPYHVTSGEIQVFADGTINLTNGEVAEVAIESLHDAALRGKTILNVDEFK